jgi:hypothetical protein
MFQSCVEISVQRLRNAYFAKSKSGPHPSSDIYIQYFTLLCNIGGLAMDPKCLPKFVVEKSGRHAYIFRLTNSVLIFQALFHLVQLFRSFWKYRNGLMDAASIVAQAYWLVIGSMNLALLAAYRFKLLELMSEWYQLWNVFRKSSGS